MMIVRNALILAFLLTQHFGIVAVASDDVPLAPLDAEMAPLDLYDVAERGGLLLKPEHATFEKLLDEQLLSFYEAILYINKAPRGATAQSMRIFTRDESFPFQWKQYRKIKVSTGRERAEQYFTSTPVGIFNIDHDRVYRMTYSRTWDNSPMPFAMFLDARYGNRKSGIAIHGAPPGSEGKLGRRASGGCIRVAHRNAEQLFEWVTNGLPGQIPNFAWDKERSRTSAAGALRLKPDGNIATKRGFKALVVIADVRD